MQISQASTIPPQMITDTTAIKAATEQTANVTQPEIITQTTATAVAADFIAASTQPAIITALQALDALSTALNALVTTSNATQVSQLASLNTLVLTSVKPGTPLVTAGKIAAWDDTRITTDYPFSIRYTVPASKILFGAYWVNSFTFENDGTADTLELTMWTTDAGALVGNHFLEITPIAADAFHNAHVIIPAAHYQAGTTFNIQMHQGGPGGTLRISGALYGNLLDVV